MLNEIIKGVSMKLNAAFGDGYKIYQDDVMQELARPCFFIAVLKPDLKPLGGKRYLNKNPLDVQYIPTAPENNAELFRVSGTLMDVLEFITLPNGELLHGTGMTFEVADGVLNFYVNYNLPLLKPTEATCMDSLAVEVGTKKG